MRKVTNKKTLFIIFVAILISFAVIWTINNFLNPINYIEQKTDIKFPNGVSQIDTYDNLEYYVVAHVKLPDSVIQNFAKDNGFSSTFPSSRIIPISSTVRLADVIFGVDDLEIENQILPNDAGLLFVSGEDGSNCWRYVLDQNSGRLWVSVIYSDRSGDQGC